MAKFFAINMDACTSIFFAMNRKRTPSIRTRSTPTGAAAKKLQQAYQAVLEQYQQERFEDAYVLAKQSLVPLAASSAQALNLVAVCAMTCKDYALAEDILLRALKILTTDASIFTNLGIVLAEQNKLQEAEQAYRRSLALDSNNARVWNNLGNILKRRAIPEDLPQAIECYKKAIAINAGYAHAHINLGLLLQDARQEDEAEKHYRLGVAADPRHATGQCNLGSLLEDKKQPMEALQCYQQAYAVQPHSAKNAGSILHLRQNLALWNDDEPPTSKEILRVIAADKESQTTPLSLLSIAQITASQLRQNAQGFAQSRYAFELRQPPLVSKPANVEGRRIRIGYLSADFRNHPVSYLAQDVILAHTASDFEVFLYAYGPPKSPEKDRILKKYVENAEHFVDINPLGPLDAAQRIAADGIDILVDLTGFTTHARLEITALRPAAVIVSWLGFIGSLGEPRLADYIIGDAVATPPEHAHHFSETLALMPQCFQPNSALQPMAPPPTRAEENLPEDAFVFCSFNQTFKFNRTLWDDWCEILRAVPDSVLWLAAAPFKESEDNLRQEAQGRGIDPQRIVFAKRVALAEHRTRIALADMALDTFPYNSGTTASDLLRAGVPLLTRMGESFVSRMAGSLLTALGMPGLIAADRASYVALAIALATEPARLQNLKKEYAEHVKNSSLFEPEKFVRQLESAYRKMLQQAIEGKKEIIYA